MSDGYHRFFSSEIERKHGKNLLEYYIDHTEEEKFDSNLKFNQMIQYFIEDYEDAEEIPYQNLMNSRQSFYTDVLLFFIFARLKSPSGELKTIIAPESNRNPAFELLYQVIENEEESILTSFDGKMSKIEDFCKVYYEKDKIPSLILMAAFQSGLLFASIVHDRRKMIDKILEKENFATVKIFYPKNTRIYRGSFYAAKKLIKYGYEDVVEFIPSSWLPSEIYEDFLDSQIQLVDDHYVEIDTTFLIHRNTKKQKVIDKSDVTTKLIFYDNTKALTKIIENKMYGDLLCHPVLSIYIKLKNFKYRRIFLWNFWIYFVMFLIYLTYAYDEVARNNPEIELISISGKTDLKYIGISLGFFVFLFLMVRKIFQLVSYYTREYDLLSEKRSKCKPLKVIRENFKEKKLLNALEYLLIISVFVAVCLDIFSHLKWIYHLSVINIFLMVGILSTMFPYFFLYFYMKLLRKVAKTFAKFLITFFMWLVTFTFLFLIIFKFTKYRIKKENEEARKNFTMLGNRTNVSFHMDNIISTFNESVSLNDEKSDVSFFDSFDNFASAILKTFLMLSGEYSIDPAVLIIFEIFIFFLFVSLTYILFNLIIGLIFYDVSMIKQNVLQIVMKDEINKFRKMNNIYINYYKNK